MSEIAADPEYRALLRYAAKIGADPTLVQGAGGNVSIKHDGVLWVKASGTWLAEAEQRDIMVPVHLDQLWAAMRSGDAEAAERAERYVVAGQNPSGLRPSIETTLHGVLRHRVVVHVHCVETMAWAARADAEAAIAPLLEGLRWRFIPYERPGAPLTRVILDRIEPDTDVLILGNHGLVAGGADTASAGALIANVAGRLRRRVRPPPPPDLARLAEAAEGSDYTAAADTTTHATATDPASLEVARFGSLYPDHVIFLGPGIVTLPPGAPDGRLAPMLVVPGAGVLLRRDASAGAVALARCLADVTARLDPAEELVALTAAQEAALLGWDAEKYRQSLDKK